MPYIDQKRRETLEARSHGFSPPKTPGELNYMVTQLAIDYIEQRGKRYATLNEVIGVLECAKLEFYRRAVAAYEDQKIAQKRRCL